MKYKDLLEKLNEDDFQAYVTHEEECRMQHNRDISEEKDQVLDEIKGSLISVFKEHGLKESEIDEIMAGADYDEDTYIEDFSMDVILEEG